MPSHSSSAAGAPAEGEEHSGPPPVRQALSDSVYESIKAMVMDHEIAPGARVGIDALSRALKVSPTPVREALARLESDGLVVKRALSGYRATQLLSRQGLAELFEMRLLLEPRAAALAADNATENQLDDLELHQRGAVGDGALAVLGRLGVPAGERGGLHPGTEVLVGLPAGVDEIARLPGGGP